MTYLIKPIVLILICSIDKLTANFSCYTCIEPLVGFTDHPNSCRFFNASSSLGLSYVKNCQDENPTGEYECRKLVISYRSVDTYLRRDCAPKGLCSWRDRTKAMETTPESKCIYTDDAEQKLECIYCCDTPLCNRTNTFVVFIRYFIFSDIVRRLLHLFP